MEIRDYREKFGPIYRPYATVIILLFVFCHREYNDLSLCKSNITDKEFWLETAILQKYTRPRGFKKYDKVKHEMYVIYPYNKGGLYSEEELKNKFSNTYEYLLQYKQLLLERSTNKWYGLSRERQYDLMFSAKIIIALDGIAQIDLNGNILFPGGMSIGLISRNKNISIYIMLNGKYHSVTSQSFMFFQATTH